MSAAGVQFDRIGELGSRPGEEQTFGFNCPRHKGRRCEGLIIAGRTTLKHDAQGQNGGVAQWDFDGNRENPTLTPSINCGGCGWHGFIVKGRCVSVAKADEPEPEA